VRKYPKMRKWKLPGKILPGSRTVFCNICNRKTFQIILINYDLLKLHIGFFCPKCDKILIEKCKKKGSLVMPNQGFGPNVPFDSKGFSDKGYGPWRS